MTEPMETTNLQDLLSMDLIELHKIHSNDLASRYDFINNEVGKILTPNSDDPVDPELNAKVSATILYISRHDEADKNIIDEFAEQRRSLAELTSKVRLHRLAEPSGIPHSLRGAVPSPLVQQGQNLVHGKTLLLFGHLPEPGHKPPGRQLGRWIISLGEGCLQGDS